MTPGKISSIEIEEWKKRNERPFKTGILELVCCSDMRRLLEFRAPVGVSFDKT